MWTNIWVVPLCFQGNPLYHADIDLEVDPPDNIYVTTPMLPENSGAEPEAQEQTEASVIPTVGIVIESGEQVPSTFRQLFIHKFIGLWSHSHCTTPTPSVGERPALCHNSLICMRTHKAHSCQ